MNDHPPIIYRNINLTVLDNRSAILSIGSPRYSEPRSLNIDGMSEFSVNKLIGSYRVYERQTWVAHHTTSSEPNPMYRRRNRTKNIQTRGHNRGDDPTKIQIAWRGESFSFSARNAPPPKPSDKTQDSAQRQVRRRKSITLVTEVPATDTEARHGKSYSRKQDGKSVTARTASRHNRVPSRSANILASEYPTRWNFLVISEHSGSVFTFSALE